MMTDFKKLRMLIDKNIFPTTETSREEQTYDFSEQVINKVLKMLEEYYLEYNIQVNFEKFESIGLNQAKVNYKYYYEYFLSKLKMQKSKVSAIREKPTTVFKDFFGSEAKNIFSYLEQITFNSKSTHIKFINTETKYYQKCRKVISELSNVPIDILNIKDQMTFDINLNNMLLKRIQHNAEEKKENSLYINDTFEKMRLKYELELNNESIHKIGLNEFENFPQIIPSFIDEKTIDNNMLSTHIFVEGYHGTGKTTLAQQIAFAISKENSFYINFSNFEREVINDNEKWEIKKFIETVKYYKGTIILDDTNKTLVSKTFTRIALEEAETIGLKLIFISTLEQHNDLKDIKTFSDTFHKGDWERLKENNLFVEISAHAHSKHYKIEILKNLLINYLPTKNLYLNIDISKNVLDYLNIEFGGLLYLLKVAIDNNKFDTLEDLKIKRAKSSIVNNYSKLVEKQHNYSFIYFSIMDLYLRIEEDKYYNIVSYKRPEILQLIEEKHMYLVGDYNFNNNVAIYFPNLVIPHILVEYLDNINQNKINLYSSEDFLAELFTFSSANIMNILRYFRVRRKEADKFYKLSRLLLNQKSFDSNSSDKLNLYEITLLISSFLKKDFSKLENVKQEELILSLSYKQYMFLKDILENMFVNGSDKYLIYLLGITHPNAIINWIAMLSKNIREYKKVKYKMENTEMQIAFIESLKFLLKMTLNALLYKKLQHIANNSKRVYESILDILKKNSLIENFSMEAEKLEKRLKQLE